MLKRFLIIVAVIVLLGGLIAYSQHRPQILKVSGFIEADEIRLGSRVGGRVLVVHVAEGEPVKQDQELVELEPFDLLQREKEAEATLAARQAELERLKNGFREEEKGQAKARWDQLKARLELLEAGPRVQEIEAARGRLQLAEAERKLAKQVFDRTNQLYDKNVATRDEMDRAIEELEAAGSMLIVRQQELSLLEAGSRQEEIAEARAQLEEAQQAWALTKSGFRQEEIEQAKAARDAAQAAINVITESKKELVIRSPVEGIVEALELQRGDLVASGAPVLSVMDDSRLWVRAYVPQKLMHLSVGQELWVTVRIHAEQCADARGTIQTSLSHQSDAQRRTGKIATRYVSRRLVDATLVNRTAAQ